MSRRIESTHSIVTRGAEVEALHDMLDGHDNEPAQMLRQSLFLACVDMHDGVSLPVRITVTVLSEEEVGTHGR